MKRMDPATVSTIVLLSVAAPTPAVTYLSPLSLVADRNGKNLYIADVTAKRITIFDVATGNASGQIPLRQTPGDLALAPNEPQLYVACAEPDGYLHVVNISARKIISRWPAGHTPSAIAVSPNGARLYVAVRFNNHVAVYDSKSGKQLARVPVLREPVALALTPDGQTLFVANLLPTAPSTSNHVAAAVSVIDTASNKLLSHLALPNGSMSLRGICVSPDGKYAYVTHILAHYQLPTTQLERGWMCTAALTVIDATQRTVLNTVLLDEIEQGAANPWAVACSPDGKWLCVTHAGTHELSIIDRCALHERLAKAAAGNRVTDVTSSYADVPTDLTFLVGIRRRVRLPGNGPRGLAITNGRAYVAEYFSGTLAAVELDPTHQAQPKPFALGKQPPPTAVRRGETVFHDAEHCFQRWQSCASCHPDARVDGLNWDLLNDGIGNPKNTKNMLYAHKTPPAMSLGVRESTEAAVRSGFKFIQFAVPTESDAKAVDEYLKSLRPVPSPYLVRGQLSAAARRGRLVFKKAGCSNCHSGPFFTNQREYNVGTGSGQDKDHPFDTPSLIECWRTAPYLHDGRAATMMEVLTTFNPGDKHGKTSTLTKQELEDLVAYLLSL
ncbi:MAG: beta-propeller fold lactonase family protein [Verrucomicrobiae bacterium]|nr:beta-propeller fold lactonase family protein [Verrucomicrobiae bacterium]